MMLSISHRLIFALGILCLESACQKEKSQSSQHTAVKASVEAEHGHDDKDGHTHAPVDAPNSKQSYFALTAMWPAELHAAKLNDTIRLKFWEVEGHELSAKLLQVSPYMVSMGHGSTNADKQVFTQTSENPSEWTIKNVYFSMGGAANTWALDVTAEVEGVSDTARIIIPLEVK